MFPLKVRLAPGVERASERERGHVGGTRVRVSARGGRVCVCVYAGVLIDRA